ncbi:hypothetical protein STSP2_00303 [Anaerohalosphaera lusitana]|uniref:Uncharacterized protein n=1 Tax=Anaerohalosphaera lusitana TaxID=1936003 RepID=A0A1U9NHT0_9BACT|nr:hypothetical protein STSP2_00303 [Anaerohalosphaera lusitana]
MMPERNGGSEDLFWEQRGWHISGCLQEEAIRARSAARFLVSSYSNSAVKPAHDLSLGGMSVCAWAYCLNLNHSTVFAATNIFFMTVG